MSAEIIIEGWYGFTENRTQHQVIERMGKRLLTTCGKSYSQSDVVKSRQRLCKNCQRYKRDFFTKRT